MSVHYSISNIVMVTISSTTASIQIFTGHEKVPVQPYSGVPGCEIFGIFVGLCDIEKQGRKVGASFAENLHRCCAKISKVSRNYFQCCGIATELSLAHCRQDHLLCGAF